MSDYLAHRFAFCEKRIIRKEQKLVLCHICNTWFHKKCSQLLGKDYNLINQNMINCCCHFCHDKSVPLSQTNESPMNNNNNQTRNLHSDSIITLNCNKNEFYNSCNSFEIPFDNGDQRLFNNSKYYTINEFSALQTKQDYFDILSGNNASLNKHLIVFLML